MKKYILLAVILLLATVFAVAEEPSGAWFYPLDTTGFVPYTGATASLDLGAYDLDATNLNVDSTGTFGVTGTPDQVVVWGVDADETTGILVTEGGGSAEGTIYGPWGIDCGVTDANGDILTWDETLYIQYNSTGDASICAGGGSISMGNGGSGGHTTVGLTFDATLDTSWEVDSPIINIGDATATTIAFGNVGTTTTMYGSVYLDGIWDLNLSTGPYWKNGATFVGWTKATQTTPLTEDMSSVEIWALAADGNPAGHRVVTHSVEDNGAGVDSISSTFYGGIVTHRTASAGDYDPSTRTSDYIIAITSTAAPRAVTISHEDKLSGTADNPRIMIIKDESGNAGTNNITISLETSGTIDGAANVVINGDYNSVSLYIDGTNAHIY